jgi:hypothetical protein
MTRNIHSPGYDYPEDTWVLGPESGGTGGKTQSDAVKGLGGIATTDVGTAGGPVPLSGKYIPEANMPTAAAGLPTVDGPTTVNDYDTNTYQITNYDSNLTYVVSATVGTVSISGDTITYHTALGSAPYSDPVTGGFTVNGKAFVILVGASYIASPSITSPTNNAVNRPTTLTLTSSPFQYVGQPTTHKASTWHIATDSGFTNIVFQTSADTVNLTSWTVSGLTENTTYYARVIYLGNNGLISWMSSVVKFTTRVNVGSLYTARLIGSDTIAGDNFSATGVSLSGDGSYAAVGAVFALGTSGAAYIFTRSGSTWTQQSKLTHPNAQANAYFGVDVRLSSDGTRLVVGAYGVDPIYSGAAYVYLRTGTTWALEASLVPGSIPGGWAGRNLCMSADGSLVAIGAHGVNSRQGCVYVYQRTGTSWALIATLSAAMAINNACYGLGISCNTDMTTLVIGAWCDDGSNVPFVDVWTRSGTTFTRVQNIPHPNSTKGTCFGYIAQVSGDAAILAVGAHGENHTYVFKKSGSTFSLFQRLSQPINGVNFGGTIAVSTTGKYIVVGSINPGTVTYFELVGSSYVMQAYNNDPTGNLNNNYSSYVALSTDNNYVIASCHTDNTNVGCAYIYS